MIECTNVLLSVNLIYQVTIEDNEGTGNTQHTDYLLITINSKLIKSNR